MRERPILFSAPMVRAILAGAKTQTRRAIAPQPYVDTMGNCCWNGSNFGQSAAGAPHLQQLASPLPSSRTGRVHCPYGAPGDRLWGRETWQYADWTEDGYPFINYQADAAQVLCERIPSDEWAARLQDIWIELSAPANYDIDGHAADRRWRPSIHMPRWACRLDMEIIGVRVQRLQEISEADAQAEGADPLEWSDELASAAGDLIDWPLKESAHPYRNGFAMLWESINGEGSWAANPWVWVVEFRRAA